MRRSIIIISILFVFLYLSSFVFSYSQLWKSHDPLLRTDVARLLPTRISQVEYFNNIDDFKEILAVARQKGWKISVAGSRHSQGGQTYYPDGVVLDMRSFNKVLNLDIKNKIIRVQSGARWKDIQEYINPYGLAVKVMQSSYIFTVGGTLSANAHGRDLDQSSVVETVQSFRLLKADGEIVNVSRRENPELFKLVIGGYGLFGIILDVNIKLTANDIYEQKSITMDYKDFPEYFQEHIQNNSNVKMMLVRPSIATDTFLQELVVTIWSVTDKAREGLDQLTGEKNVLRDKFLFGLSRQYQWAKNLRWNLQKKIESGIGEIRLVSRNNAMRPPLAPLELLDYYSSTDTDILQEYYIPVRNFIPFMDAFRNILLKNKMNVISSTIRYVKANDETYLAYAPKEDAFAIIQMSNVGLSQKAQASAQKVTQELVDAALKYSGTYYLTYQLYPTFEQLRQAYPQAQLFFEKKLQYDPQEIFVNKFYEKYAK